MNLETGNIRGTGARFPTFCRFVCNVPRFSLYSSHLFLVAVPPEGVSLGMPAPAHCSIHRFTIFKPRHRQTDASRRSSLPCLR